MNEEYHYLMVNDTSDHVLLLKGTKLSQCKLMYTIKYSSNGSVERHRLN